LSARGGCGKLRVQCRRLKPIYTVRMGRDMNELLDKLVISLFCFIFYVQNASDQYTIVPVILAVTCSALSTIFPRIHWRLSLLALFTVVCFYFPGSVFFIPLIAYDILVSRFQGTVLLLALPILFHQPRFTIISNAMITAFVALAWLMKYRSTDAEHTRQEYTSLRDSTMEFSLQLEEKNRELMDRQDYEVKLATLQERNRIAREIHDNIGHVLSSSILQTGALLAGCQDESLEKNLNMLNTTLSAGMSSIRDSIHDLHDDSLDLKTEIHNLTDGFAFCPVTLEYDIEAHPTKEIKYAFMSIVKEGLSNIIKHSDANEVQITMREHPGLYQLIIRDNGSEQPVRPNEGIGLKNITSRVNSLGGNINISNNHGFTLFISVPRG